MTHPITPTSLPHHLQRWLSSLDRWIILGRMVLLLERLWLRLWPVASILAVFLASMLLGFLQSLPGLVHALVVIGSMVVLMVLLYRQLSGLRMPTRSEALQRLENDLAIPHRPLSTLTDTLAIQKHNLITVRLWEVSRTRILKQMERLCLSLPRPEVAACDPLALRFVAVILLVIAAVSSWGSWSSRLATGLWPAFGHPASSLVIDAWITPPPYTQLPPSLLPRPKERENVTSDATDDATDVPIGSTILVIVSGISSLPQLIIADNPQHFTRLDERQYQIESQILSGTQITLETSYQTLAQWKIHIVTDRPPQSHLEELQIFPRGVLGISFQAEDDYGLQTVSAIIVPSIPENQSIDPLILSLSEDTNGSLRTVTATSFHDLTSHAWAGRSVTLQLQASDHVGQKTLTDPVTLILPERTFTHPVARDIIALRRRLLHEGESVQDEVASGLDVLSRTPGRFHEDIMVFLALRLTHKMLLMTRSVSVHQRVATLLWQTALRLEDGGVTLSLEELRTLQQELAEALRNGASDERITELVDALQTALRQYLAALQRHALQNLPSDATLSSLSQGMHHQSLSQNDLAQMLSDIRDLWEMGDHTNAQRMLERFQTLLESLDSTPRQLSQQQQLILHALEIIQDLITRQRDLLDRSFQEQTRQHADETSDTSDTSTSPLVLNELAEEQMALSAELEDVRSVLPGVPSEILEHFTTANQAMNEAVEFLERGVANQAVLAQTQALEEMQNGFEKLIDHLANSRRGGGGLALGSRRSLMGQMGQNGRDPLGRWWLQESDIIPSPDLQALQRVRQLLDHIRNRVSERHRPRFEREYLERLLDRF